jgi:ankyrin repeat protein
MTPYKASQDTDSDSVKSSPSQVQDATALVDNRSTSLLTASEEGNLNMVQSLLGQGADVNERCEFSMTPLYRAS